MNSFPVTCLRAMLTWRLHCPKAGNWETVHPVLSVVIKFPSRDSNVQFASVRQFPRLAVFHPDETIGVAIAGNPFFERIPIDFESDAQRAISQMRNRRRVMAHLEVGHHAT